MLQLPVVSEDRIDFVLTPWTSARTLAGKRTRRRPRLAAAADAISARRSRLARTVPGSTVPMQSWMSWRRSWAAALEEAPIPMAKDGVMIFSPPIA